MAMLDDRVMLMGKASPGEAKARTPWLLVFLSSVLVFCLLAFHFQWDRPVTSSPIDLPEISYSFTQHPDLLPFDKATQERWNAIISKDWWNMGWSDESSGQVVTRGIDMLHKIHCLVAVREEFTTLVSDPNYYLKFQAKNPGSADMRLHIGHCFDFLRQDILCAADDTLEPLGTWYLKTDGIGLSHRCRDWRVLMKYAGLWGRMSEVL